MGSNRATSHEAQRCLLISHLQFDDLNLQKQDKGVEGWMNALVSSYLDCFNSLYSHHNDVSGTCHLEQIRFVVKDKLKAFAIIKFCFLLR